MLEALLNRQSILAANLVEPIPSRAQLLKMVAAAVTAPDHGALQPWEFIFIEGEARKELGNVFAQALALREPGIDEVLVDAQRKKPLRSPLIVAAVAKVVADHPKVPRIEQIISAAMAAQHFQLAAQALGFGSILLTGPNAHDWHVKEALGLNVDDELIGFIYLGTIKAETDHKIRPQPDTFIREWYQPDSLDTAI